MNTPILFILFLLTPVILLGHRITSNMREEGRGIPATYAVNQTFQGKAADDPIPGDTLDKKVIPVQLIEFRAVPAEAGVKLMWRTASELNALEFVLRKKQEPGSWRQIGTVPASGNSQDMRSYSFTDSEPVQSPQYYQLVQYDLDGTSHAYPVIVYHPVNPESVRIFPNPVVNGQITVRASEQGLLQIVNPSGQLVMVRALNEGDNRISVRGLVPGMYHVRTGEKTFIMQIP